MRYVISVSFEHPLEMNREKLAELIDNALLEELHPYDVVIHEVLRYDPDKTRVFNCCLELRPEREMLPL